MIRLGHTKYDTVASRGRPTESTATHSTESCLCFLEFLTDSREDDIVQEWVVTSVDGLNDLKNHSMNIVVIDIIPKREVKKYGPREKAKRQSLIIGGMEVLCSFFCMIGVMSSKTRSKSTWCSRYILLNLPLSRSASIFLTSADRSLTVGGRRFGTVKWGVPDRMTAGKIQPTAILILFEYSSSESSSSSRTSLLIANLDSIVFKSCYAR